LPLLAGGRGGLTMSLLGGLEEVVEFFLSLAISAFNRSFSVIKRRFSVSSAAIRVSNGAIASATASAIMRRTSSSVNHRAMPLS
jgi:hypothetical protein